MWGLADGVDARALRRWVVGGCVVAALTVGAPAVAGAAVFHVTGTSDGVAACSGSNCPTLRSAVLAADALGGSNTIKVPAGLYDLTVTPSGTDNGLTGDLHITKNLTIAGAGPGATIIRGERDRIFDISAPEVTLSGLGITHGSNVLGGGAVSDHGDSASLRLADDAFIANTTASSGAGVGGAVDFAVIGTGTLSITHTLFRSNTAAASGDAADGFGGAVFFASNVGRLTVTSSEFDSNTAQAGTISGGSAGGAITFQPAGNGSPLIISGSTFSENTAAGSSTGFAVGGAVLDEPGGFESPLSVTNSTFVGNRAGGVSPNSLGGAIAGQPAGPPMGVRLTQVTMVANTVGSQGTGGGIYSNTSPVGIANSIISGNVGAPGADNCGGIPPTPLGHNIELGTSCGFDINANPLVLPLANNGGPTRTMALMPGSPARDAADPAFCPATDQRGVPRPDDPGTPCDIGAYESVTPH